MIKLSTEVKGYIADFIAKSIYSWEKIKTLAMRVGIDDIDIDKFSNKRQLARYIVDNFSDTEILLRTIFDMSKKGAWDNDHSKELLLNINPIMSKTMGYKFSDEGEIIEMKTKDLFEESQWSIVEVNTPRNLVNQYNFFEKLLQRFPILKYLLKNIFN